MAETANAYTVPQWHINQFTANVALALVRKGGILRPYVTQGAYRGDKIQVVRFLGPVEFVERDTPYADTIVTEPEHTQRWVNGRDFDLAILVDRIDTLREINDPTNMYVEAMRAAAGRKEDTVIMDRVFATALSGKNGESTVAFPAQDQIVNGGTGLTVAKLRAARKLLKKRFVDLQAEKPYIAVTAQQTDDLLGEVAVGSSDYNAVKPLVDGEVSAFMGFMFVPIEGVLPYAANVRSCPVWVPSGLHFGSWQNLAITIGPRADKNNIPQIHGCMTMGATRLQEGKVLMLDCADTSGA